MLILPAVIHKFQVDCASGLKALCILSSPGLDDTAAPESETNRKHPRTALGPIPSRPVNPSERREYHNRDHGITPLELDEHTKTYRDFTFKLCYPVGIIYRHTYHDIVSGSPRLQPL